MITLLYELPDDEMPRLVARGLEITDSERISLTREMNENYHELCRTKKGTYRFQTALRGLGYPLICDFEILSSPRVRDPSVSLVVRSPVSAHPGGNATPPTSWDADVEPHVLPVEERICRQVESQPPRIEQAMRRVSRLYSVDSATLLAIVGELFLEQLAPNVTSEGRSRFIEMLNQLGECNSDFSILREIREISVTVRRADQI